ncbi:Protein translocase subunit SecDF [Paenibacillus plantiphilus]|uniref:Multifunctional fusion protein n=1 Tax=Paenibacillus plantiphilus TaxID=2905650 RepID=A0ABM9CVI2_9BACL|nr:protein translocase subunit SecD [Paenibacillus plantiphilus]CAH1224926.1 Protein translocase subunit SecDF [Paenibacillus plantiphilus]
MIIKRVTAFFAAIIIAFTIIGITTPSILDGIKLGLDLKGGFEILYEAKPVIEGGEITKEALRETAKSLEKRADAYGVAEPEVTPEGDNRIRARIAGVSNHEKVKEIMRKPAELTFRGPDGTVEMHGSDFVEGAAVVSYDQLNEPMIMIEVKEKSKLEAVSKKLYKQPLAIYLDEEVLSAPIVQAVLTDGSATISGSYTKEEAQELADVINLGALPLKLEEKYTQSVGATLGQQSLDQTLLAGTLASIFILLFMLILYRIPGVIACITLIVYSWALLLIFYWMNATLTLPGIAAFVLGIGMAVDANIITAERIREEMRSGKSLLSALKAGSKNSFRTIMDANVTTIVAAAVLYFIGTGAIQGFALTLILSNLLSMLTNVGFSRFLLQLLIKSGMVKKSELMGVKAADIASLSDNSKETKQFYRIFNFVKHRKLFFSLSIGVTIIGIVTMLAFNLNYGVDFKAGTNLDISVGQSITKERAEQIFAEAGLAPATLTIGGDNNSRITARFDKVLNYADGDVNRVLELFKAQYGDKVSPEENTVDPGIAQELGIKAIVSIIIASIGIIVLVMLRFEWRFALAAIIALFHDAFMVVSVFSIFRLEVNLPFVAAILTIIGYSINDTIVIFDRIRENLRFAKIKTFEQLEHLVNVSISQTLSRSINTGITVLVASLILLVLGSESIKLFSLAMTLGLVFGIYSTIFIASQLWLIMKKREINKKASIEEEAEKQDKGELPSH